MPAARKRFFISYSRADKDLVGPVVEILKTAPTEVFFDRDSIKPGDNWSQRLERAIKGASKFVIFWCTHSAHSHWVRKEWQLAIEDKKLIVPVLLDKTPLPRKLAAFQWISFIPWADALHSKKKTAKKYEVRHAHVMAGLLRDRLRVGPALLFRKNYLTSLAPSSRRTSTRGISGLGRR